MPKVNLLVGAQTFIHHELMYLSKESVWRRICPRNQCGDMACDFVSLLFDTLVHNHSENHDGMLSPSPA